MHLERTRRVLLVALVALLGAAGCGTAVSVADGGVSDSATDAGATPPCPAAQPSAGTSCTREGLVCEYGDDPRPQCRPAVSCATGQWATRTTPAGCEPPPPAMCPASRDAAQGQTCSPLGAYCSYEQGLACACTNCPGPQYPVGHCNPPGVNVWDCAAPNANPQCPAAQPNLGTACSPEGTTCAYGCEPERNLVCQGGAWITDPSHAFGCPVSTRRAKRDIEYLTPDATATLADAVLRTRLATYEYVDPALAGRRRLGFIIEDQPTSYAVDPERSQVDLYGYTSMLVAAVQDQARQIEDLRREVAALRQHHGSPASARSQTPARRASPTRSARP